VIVVARTVEDFAMDLKLSQVQEEMVERAHTLCRLHCSPEQEAQRERDGQFPAGLHRALAEAGLLGQSLPRSVGGGGGGLLDCALISEVLGHYSGTALALYFVNGVCGALIARAGSPEQQSRLLPGLMKGELRFAFALTEPHAGSDAAAISTRASCVGEEYVIDGAKLFTTGALEADYILTIARTDPRQKASGGSSVLIVPRTAPGLSCVPQPKIAGNGYASCEVRYSGVRVPALARLGPENGAWTLLGAGSAIERITIAAGAVGTAQAAYDQARAFTTTREQFGQPVAKFQAVQHQLADMATRIEAMRWLTYRAAWLADQGRMAAGEISMAKLFCSETSQDILTAAMRLSGGRGYLEDTGLARRWREGFLAFYAGGTNEIQRNTIARYCVGL